MDKKRFLLIFFIILLIGIGVFFGKKYFSFKVANKNETQPTFTSEKKNDTIAPIITLDEFRPQIIVKGEEFKTNATAKDETDGDLTDSIISDGLDTSKEGEFDVVLKVSDKAGNTTEKKQKVIVRDELAKSGLPVTMYHFFYDNEKYFKQDNNWLDINDFDKQLNYLNENNFYFPTWEEVELYLDGKIKLPSKSVVLTCDDGDPSFFDLAVPVMQKYHIPVTSFVVTEWYGHKYDANLEYVVWESHSANMHQSGSNGKGRMVNWTKAQIVEDLNSSSQVLGGADIFCYPFGHYNDTAIEALKEANYKMAFTVEGGRITPGMNKYKLPRVRVTAGNSLEYFKKSVS